MKYTKNYIRDFNWYLKIRHLFNFDGHLDRPIVYDKDGVDGKMGFYIFDSTGKLKPTKHPNLLKSLLKTKGSVNLHIKMYAEDRVKGLLPKAELMDMCEEWGSPEWFFSAIERTKNKLAQNDPEIPDWLKPYYV